MMQMQLLTVGKQKEPHLTAAQEVYQKRLTPFCKWEFTQLPAVRLSDKPSEKEIAAALEQEAAAIRKAARGTLIAMCIEWKQRSSEAFARLINEELPMRGSAVTFVIGSSCGLSESLKREAYLRLSMSEMTFPHALAAVMLMEQIYRAYQIGMGTGYHK
ncbi:MAG: 23S rRNA (pseudouridine(1915)-N(3))-methyltransferase RlmH [Oscillospiraceae bacterium]|nr:23S rRNA (pseudouridine(1915)-N(3))-methyltransferase RlmH [Oscillospiraceae bacterium]